MLLPPPLPGSLTYTRRLSFKFLEFLPDLRVLLLCKRLSLLELKSHSVEAQLAVPLGHHSTRMHVDQRAAKQGVADLHAFILLGLIDQHGLLFSRRAQDPSQHEGAVCRRWRCRRLRR